MHDVIPVLKKTLRLGNGIGVKATMEHYSNVDVALSEYNNINYVQRPLTFISV